MGDGNDEVTVRDWISPVMLVFIHSTLMSHVSRCESGVYNVANMQYVVEMQVHEDQDRVPCRVAGHG
jgi:hypothetical protein